MATLYPEEFPDETPYAEPGEGTNTVQVSAGELQDALDEAAPGDRLVLAPGTYDGEFTMSGVAGTAAAPISVDASASGVNFAEGSTLYVEDCAYVSFLGWRMPYGLPDGPDGIVQFRGASHHCRFDEFVIGPDSHPGEVAGSGNYIFVGNECSHIYLGFGELRNKGYAGNGVRVYGNFDTNQVCRYVRIHHLDVHDFYPGAVNDFEPIRVGVSSMSRSDAFAVVERCVFTNIRSEPEITSLKAANIRCTGNAYVQCAGSGVYRHGVDGLMADNYFIDGENTENTNGEGSGGHRFYDAGHEVAHNYYERLSGTNYQGTLMLDRGDAESGSSQLNAHWRVVRANVHHNVIVDCAEPLRIGSDNYDLLPADCTVVDNLAAGDNYSAAVVYEGGASASSTGTVARNEWAADPAGVGLTQDAQGIYRRNGYGPRLVMLTRDDVGPGGDRADGTGQTIGEVEPDQDTAAARYGWGRPHELSDEFDYEGTPDPARWDLPGEDWPGHNGNGRRRPERQTVTDGKLVMTGLANGDTGWMEHQLNLTGGGRWEARMRSQQDAESNGNDYHVLLLIWPESNDRPLDGEYDLFENSVPGETGVTAFMHYPHPWTNEVQQERFHIDGIDTTEWHNYAFEYVRGPGGHVKGFIDGEEWFSHSGGAVDGLRRDIQDMPAGHLCIQLDNFDGTNQTPARMEVEWVRAYPLDNDDPDEPDPPAGDTTRCELRETENGADAAWDIATTGMRELTVSGVFDPSTASVEPAMTVGRIGAPGDAQPLELLVDHNTDPAALRVFVNGQPAGDALTGLTPDSEITYRITVTEGRVELRTAAGGVDALPTQPDMQWAASEFTNATGCYLACGTWNVSPIEGGSGESVAAITHLQLIQPDDDPNPPDPDDGRTRCELRETQDGADAAWDVLTAGTRELTVTGIFDPSTASTAPVMTVGRIGSRADVSPLLLQVDHSVASPALRVYLDGELVGDALTGLTPTSEITYRIVVDAGQVKLYAVVGTADQLAEPLYTWAASEFTDPTGCYFAFGAWNVSTIEGGAGESVAVISHLALVQSEPTQVVRLGDTVDTSTVFTPATVGPDLPDTQVIETGPPVDTSIVWPPASVWNTLQTIEVGDGAGSEVGPPIVDTSVVFSPNQVGSGIRPPLRIDFWALADLDEDPAGPGQARTLDGAAQPRDAGAGLLAVGGRQILCPLPQPVAWDLSLIPGEDGAVRLEYPVDGINFDVLDERVNRARDLFVHIRTTGSMERALGAILTARQGDEVSEQGTVTFIGSFLTALLREGWLPYNDDDPGAKGETHFAGATAGEIMDWVLTATQAAGFCTELTWNFDGQRDSAGYPWPADQHMSATFSPGASVMSIAQELRSWGVLEFEVSTNFEVRCFVPDTVGVDHTAQDPPIVLRVGRDLVDAPRRTDVSDAATDLMVIGRDGTYVTLSDPSARARRGRNVGQVVSEGSLLDEASARAFGTVELARRVWGVDELTHTLTFDQDHPTPLVELRESDWVYSDTGKGFTEANRERIAQLTVSNRAGEDHYTGGVVLRDLISERDVALQRQIDRLRSGSTVIGTSNPGGGSGEDDTVPPAAPEGLVVASDVAFQVPGDTLTYAEVSAQWLPVTTNANGTAATDIAGYRLRWAYLGFDQVGGLPSSNPDNEPLLWYQPEGSPTTGLRLTWGDAEGGRDIGVQVAAYDRSGNQSEWSARVDITTEVDDTAPPAPSAPIPTVWFRTIDVHWDGFGSEGEPMPEDTEYVEVWFSQQAAFAVPATVGEPTPFDPAATAPQHVANLSGRVAGTWNQPDIPVDVGWFIGLRAVDRARNASPLSPVAGPITAEQLVQIDIGPDAIGRAQIIDGEIVNAKIANLAVNNAKISDLEVGKLTTGTLQATVVLGDQIRTAPIGANTSRGEFDGAGLRLYDDSNTLTVNLDATDGTALITGTIQSALSGERWMMHPDGTLRLYPQAGNNYSEIANLGNDVVWRGPIGADGRSGRVNVNQLGVGINFSAENEIPNDLRSEVVVFDRQARVTAPFTSLVVDGRYESPSSNPDLPNDGRRIQFSTTDDDGTFISRSGLSYGIDSDGWGGFYGNDTGFKFARVGPNGNGDDGRVVATTGTLGNYGYFMSNGIDVPSSETVKTDIEDARALLDPLGTIKAARARKFRSVWSPNEAPRVGVIAEELPEALQRPMAALRGEPLVGIELSSQIGVLWGAIGQLLDQEARSVTGRALVPPGTYEVGATVDVDVLWDDEPLEIPTDVTALAMVGPPAALGQVRTRVVPGSATLTGCRARLEFQAEAPVTVTADEPIAVEAIGRYIWQPPYTPEEPS